MGVDAYMSACLHDPEDGYYTTRPALGEDGDFITAPLVSQMFGELLGLWAVETWRGLGRPARLVLVEAGPGDGTLIDDALRAARLDPDFMAAAELWLVETSRPLIAAQARKLAAAPLKPRWVAGLDELPDDAPMILIANELLDCLPARQFIRTPEGWAERVVGLDAAGELAFGLRHCPAPTHLIAPPLGELSAKLTEGAFFVRGAEPPGPLHHPAGGPPPPTGAEFEIPLGAILEISATQSGLAAALAARLADQGGAALLIDYGRDRPESGDTLQALHLHQKVDPLAAPGQADLTIHADFPAVLASAHAQGAQGICLTQGAFLKRLGIEARADGLARARPDRAAVIARQLDRLIGDDQMGLLFKAACLYAAGHPIPPGFEAAA